MERFKNAIIFILIVICQSSARNGEENQPFFLTPSLTASVHVPVSSAASYWNCYPTAGIRITLPSTLSGLSVAMGMEGGVITDADKALKIQCLNIRCGIMFTDIVQYNNIKIVPIAGVSSLMIGAASDGLIDLSHWHVFGRVENEYGVYAGVEPLVTWKKLTFSLPVSAERIFSDPRRFTTVVFSVIAGYRFDK